MRNVLLKNDVVGITPILALEVLWTVLKKHADVREMHGLGTRLVAKTTESGSATYTQCVMCHFESKVRESGDVFRQAHLCFRFDGDLISESCRALCCIESSLRLIV